MLSSESDLFQEPSFDEGTQGRQRENSVQFLCNHNQSFFSQQSSSSSSNKSSYLFNDETIPIKKPFEKQLNLQTPMFLNVPQQSFAKTSQNKMVILSSKKMRKQVEVNSNTSLTNIGCNLGTQETVESDDNKSESADENVKRSSLDKIQIDQEDDDTITHQLEKKFISPRTMKQFNLKNTQKQQNQLDLSLSLYTPSKYSNVNELLVMQRNNPKMIRVNRMNTFIGHKNQQNHRNNSSNERLNTEPVISRSNTPMGERNGNIKTQLSKRLQQNRSNSVNGAYLKNDATQIQIQFANEKKKIQHHNARSNSTSGSEKIPAFLLRKEIDSLLSSTSPQRIKTESSCDTRKNSQAVIVMNRNLVSPLRKRPLLQPVKISSKQDYEKEAMDLIKFYECNTTANQQQFQESPTKSMKGSPIKPSKKFTDSLFKLSNQITQMEKSMLTSYYKDFIRITPI